MKNKTLSTLLAFSLLIISQNITAETINISEMELSNISQGWGQARKDKSVGGNPINIAGKVYPHGIGTHAISRIRINLHGTATRFSALAGVDNESEGKGSVEFIVAIDGKTAFKSGEMTSRDAAKQIDINLKGAAELLLTVTDAGNGNASDHADWAMATIEYSGKKPEITSPFNVFAGADESTPSRAQYFSWINNTNEGATEAHTLANLNFFKYLHDEYGMILDIYAFDAGAIDGKFFYGSMDSERFKEQFPNGFDPIYQKAASIGTRLGIWGGPDGFGQTPEEQEKRIRMMESLCRDYEFMLFKFDAVCGQLRKDKEPAFIEMMTRCRKHSPDLIALNHRLPLSPEGLAHMTTNLMGGAETYIDVFMNNRTTGTHHRVGAISRGLTPNLTRLTEDHGVCISSCLDFWDDDMILQAFNRCLILAPEVYGSPFFLRDDELAKFARIYNLHRRFGKILPSGMTLPENSCGPLAVSRGDNTTRLITLRNLTWNPATYTVRLDSEIGLVENGPIELRQFHPTERIIGTYSFGQTARITVMPFRSCLLIASSAQTNEIALTGCDYNVIRDIPSKPVKIEVLGMPGSAPAVSLKSAGRKFTKATLDGRNLPQLLSGKTVEIKFDGTSLNAAWHRKIADLKSTTLPTDAESLYEATCYAADNNALEARSIERSGASEIPAVKAAREAFFNQHVFKGRGLWDRYLFDSDPDTCFYPSKRYGIDQRINGGALRVDFGSLIQPDKIILSIPDQYSLMPMLEDEGATYAYVSPDLKSWTRIHFIHGEKSAIYIPEKLKVRYLRITNFPYRISEINAYSKGRPLARENWRASNLFSPFDKLNFNKAWSANFTITQSAPGSYLCLAVNGHHGREGVYPAIRTPQGTYIGSPDRATSYPSNTWEFINRSTDSNYTYYFPVTEEMLNSKLEIILLGSEKTSDDIRPELWITANPIPFTKKSLILE